MANRKKTTYSDEARAERRSQCWSYWCRGITNMSAIATQIGADPRTVAKDIDFMRTETIRQMVQGNEAAEIFGGFKETIKAAWRVYEETNNANAKIGAVGRIQDGYKQLAAMFGITSANIKIEQHTEVEHSGELDIDISDDSVANVLHILAEAGAFDPDVEADGEAADE